jgi:hypothetical protein
MKRIGRYFITGVGLLTMGAAPALFARDFDYGRDRDRREYRREERRERERRLERERERERELRRFWR